MSRAKAKADRVEHDYYPTPAWCVDRILDTCNLLRWHLEPDALGRKSAWLEPCAGEGHLIHAVNDWTAVRQAIIYPGVQAPIWNAQELRSECEPALRPLIQPGGCDRLRIGDYLKTPAPERKYDVGFTNPPFTLWQQFHFKMTQECEIVAMLLRVGVLGSAGRRQFWQQHNCDVYIMADRPSFTGDGGTDSDYYAWFLWHKNADRRWRVI